MSIYRMVLAGLAVMGAVALLSAIWPGVAAVVTDVFVAVVATAAAGPLFLAVRRVRSELAWRREVRTMASVAEGVQGTEPAVPTLAELRESA